MSLTWTPAEDDDLTFTKRGTLSSDAVTYDGDTLTAFLDDLDTSGGGADHTVAVFADDFDPTGSFTTVPLLPGGDIPRAILTGATILIVEGDHLGLWTIPASGAATAGTALAPADLIVAKSGRVAVAQTVDGSTVSGVLIQADIDGAYARANHTGTQAQSTITNLTSDLAAKAPTSRTITAGNGLAGGGDLSADRTFAIDATTLARIGVTVEATSDSSARTSTTATADGTLQFEAAADTTYRVDAYLIFQGDATADLKLGFTTPTSTMHLTVEGALTTVASGSDYDRFLTLTSSGATTVVGIAGASTPISVRVSGVIRCSSAGTVALIWAPNGAGAGTGVTRLARSQLHYRAA